MKEITAENCAECGRAFQNGEVVNYTWYENRCFCNDCKEIMNERVSVKYLDWQKRQVSR